MNHKHKTLIFKVLDVLPSRLGYYIYHRLQDAFSKQSLDYKITSTENSWKVVDRILSDNGLSIKGKHVTEMGSGWLPIFPYFLKLKSDAAQIDTYDINYHYNPKKIKSLNDKIAKTFGLSMNDFKGKHALLTDIEYFPRTPIEEAKLEKTDLIVSRFVLEHVPPDIMKNAHQCFVNNMKPGAHILHLISPSDHRAYADAQLSLYDFLKYSEAEWNAIQTKFDYHNRLRLPQYLELFADEFEVVSVAYQSCKKDSKQYEKFYELTIHPDFENYSFEELTAGSINILLKKL